MSDRAVLTGHLWAYRAAEVDAREARQYYKAACRDYERRASRKALEKLRRLGKRKREAEMRLSESVMALGFDLLSSVNGPLVFEINKIDVRERLNYRGDLRIHVYFGGDGRRAGYGHGHYAFTPEFDLEYRREPGSSRYTSSYMVVKPPSLPLTVRISNLQKIKRVAAATFPSRVSDCV